MFSIAEVEGGRRYGDDCGVTKRNIRATVGRSRRRKVRNVRGSLLPTEGFGGVASQWLSGADSRSLPNIGQDSWQQPNKHQACLDACHFFTCHGDDRSPSRMI